MSTEKKQDILDTLIHPELSPVDKFNQLLREYQNHDKRNKNILQSLNRQGYSANSYNKLVYEIKKIFNISDVEAKTHVLPKETGNCPTCIPTTNVSRTDEVNNNITDLSSKKEEIENKDDSTKLREEFTFLNKENTPDEFKILVADRITIFKKLAEMRGIVEDPNTPEDIRAELAPKIAQADEANDAIWKELNHYQETGEVLGNHPIFSTLSLERKIETMTASEKIQRVETIKGQIRTAKMHRGGAKSKGNLDKVAEFDGKIKNYELEIKLITKSLEKANNE
ncbi:hypothetical protein ACTS9T_03840 [Empedobacter falsenii]